MSDPVETAIQIERLARNIYPNRAPGEIQPLQWAILRFVNRTTDGPRGIRRIAAHLGLTTAPVSRAAATLEKRGLLKIRRNPRDARAVIVELTRHGQEVLEGDPILALAEAIDVTMGPQVPLLYENLTAITDKLERVLRP